MEKVIGRYLQPSGDTGLYSIGADIVQGLNNPELMFGGVQTLRSTSQELLMSEHPDDAWAATMINGVFTQNDHHSATTYLNRQIDTPVSENIVEWLARGTDRDIEQFCRWSLQRTWHLTKALRRDKPGLVRRTLDKTHALSDTGVIPPTAIPVIEAATDRYNLRGMDSFHSGGPNNTAFCMANTIVIANTYQSRRYMMRTTPLTNRTMFHEYMHGAGRDRGFFWGIKQTGPTVLRVFEEAFVEHLTTVAYTPRHPQPRIVDPTKRSTTMTDGSWYRPERTFMAETMDHTGIAWEELSEAYFLPRGDERGEFLREDIERKIGKFFGSLEGFFAFTASYEHASAVDRVPLLQNTITHLTDPKVA